MVIALKVQKPHEIVHVDLWSCRALAEVYPEGTRDKRLVFCPENISLGFLIGGHKYLFKESMRRHPVQIFSEIVAYRFGWLVGVHVPPAFLAIENRNGEKVCGALIEWFYDYPDCGRGDIYIRGGDLAEDVIADFDSEKGTQHNIKFVNDCCDALQKCQNEDGIALFHDPLEHWTKVFVFDALIGNTDRHQDNWGVLRLSSGRGFSPAFDNGTSLGYEFFDDRLDKFDDPVQLESYIKRGRHHVRWSAEGDERIPHIELVRHLVKKYPKHKKIVTDILNFDEQDLYNIFGDLVDFDSPVKFSGKRLDFVIKLLLKRKSFIKDVIG